MQLLENHRSTIDTVDGYGWKTLYLKQNIVYQIIVEAESPGTVFDVILENAFGDEVFVSQSNEGICNEVIELPMATHGTLKIYNATADETFIYCLATKVN